jgi:hypothetical protein
VGTLDDPATVPVTSATSKQIFVSEARPDTVIFANIPIYLRHATENDGTPNEPSMPVEPVRAGGHRLWFICPSCGRRCAILYPTRCRKCVNGRYAVELMTPHDRKISKAIELRRRLGQMSGGTIAAFPPKPKWMRWHTYLARRAKSMALETEIWAAEHARFFR